MNDRHQQVIDQYLKGDALGVVAKSTGFSRQWTRKILRDNNIRNVTQHHETINLNFFDKIDSEEKAYFLGFMYADGNIYLGNKNRKHYTVSITLAEEDKYILERFRDLIAPDHKLYFKSYRIKHPNQQDQWTFAFENKIVVEQLFILGCGSKKSLVLKFPKFLSGDLLRHFIRGYFDGDGCVSSHVRKDNGYKTYNISIMSTRNFIMALQSEMKKLNLNPTLTYKNNNITTELTMGGNHKVKTFLDWIYKDATIFLNRKNNKYLGLVESIENKMVKTIRKSTSYA